MYTIKIFALLLLSLPLIQCLCRKSYMTFCDTFKDLKHYNDSENLSELVIGSEESDIEMTSVSLPEVINLNNFQKLITLHIVRTINHLHISLQADCHSTKNSLNYLSFYANVIKRIEPYQFPQVPLKKLSLVNNQVGIIEEYALVDLEVEEIDLSDNFLEIIANGAIPKSAKIVTVRNNRLVYLDSVSLPTTVRLVDLQKNQLRHISEHLLRNLVNLVDLDLSYNDLTSIPDTKLLRKLKILDLSNNCISTIPSETPFKNSSSLDLIDLSNNKFFNSAPFSLFDFVPPQQMTILLGGNKIRKVQSIKTEHLANKVYYIYGNPWYCGDYGDLMQKFTGYVTECDVEFAKRGDAPYCIDYDKPENYVSPQHLSFDKYKWESTIDEFLKVVRENKGVIACIKDLKKKHKQKAMGLGKPKCIF